MNMETLITANEVRAISEMYKSLIELSHSIGSNNLDYFEESAEIFLDWVVCEVDMSVEESEDE